MQKEFGNKREEGITPPDVCAGIIEYKMSKVMADDILKESKGKRPTQEVLCEYVNTQCGLKGYCVKVFVDIE